LEILNLGQKSENADGFAELLKLHGALLCVDGPSATKCARDAIPDLILGDFGLPGAMDAFAVDRACRANASLKKVRLLAASGYVSAEYFTNAMTAGFDFLPTKPPTEISLRSLIH
jgi:CheY-like chemotaxis protein